MRTARGMILNVCFNCVCIRRDLQQHETYERSQADSSNVSTSWLIKCVTPFDYHTYVCDCKDAIPKLKVFLLLNRCSPDSECVVNVWLDPFLMSLTFGLLCPNLFSVPVSCASAGWRFQNSWDYVFCTQTPYKPEKGLHKSNVETCYLRPFIGEVD